MTLQPYIVEAIEACKTPGQVLDILDKNKIEVFMDDSDEVGDGTGFSIWLDETTRIYQTYIRKEMKVQYWTRCKMEYSGIPVYFGH